MKSSKHGVHKDFLDSFSFGPKYLNLKLKSQFEKDTLIINTLIK